jgi:hypothetical protein
LRQVSRNLSHSRGQTFWTTSKVVSTILITKFY